MARGKAGAQLAIALVLVVLGAAAAGCGSRTSSHGSPATTAADSSASDPYDYGGGSDDYSSDGSDYAPYSDAQDAWDNQDGPDWEAFNDAYLAGWNEGCDARQTARYRPARAGSSGHRGRGRTSSLAARSLCAAASRPARGGSLPSQVICRLMHSIRRAPRPAPRRPRAPEEEWRSFPGWR
jgi:hypothetical protein